MTKAHLWARLKAVLFIVMTFKGQIMTKYILCTGNITQGFRFFGVFESHEKAMSYGVLALGESGFIISELIDPDRHFFEQIKGAK